MAARLTVGVIINEQCCRESLEKHIRIWSDGAEEGARTRSILRPPPNPLTAPISPSPVASLEHLPKVKGKAGACAMPAAGTPEPAWGQRGWVRAALGTAGAPSPPHRLCLRRGSNYRNVQKRSLSVGKHFSGRASAGSCRAGIRVGDCPLSPTPPSPDPHPISRLYPPASHACACPGQPLARWVINPRTDYNSLHRL